MTATLTFASQTLFHHRRLIVLMGVLGLLVGLATALLSPRLFYARVLMDDPFRFDPENAVYSAERDFREGNIQFYFVGGIVPSAPGIPDRHYALTQKYKQAVAGTDLGCSGSSDKDQAFARHYNQRMLWLLTQ